MNHRVVLVMELVIRYTIWFHFTSKLTMAFCEMSKLLIYFFNSIITWYINKFHFKKQKKNTKHILQSHLNSTDLRCKKFFFNFIWNSIWNCSVLFILVKKRRWLEYKFNFDEKKHVFVTVTLNDVNFFRRVLLSLN